MCDIVGTLPLQNSVGVKKIQLNRDLHNPSKLVTLEIATDIEF